MKVLLAAAVPLDRSQTPIPAFEKIARQDRFGVHALTDDPAAADVILFVDPHMHSDWRLHAIRQHPLTRQYPDKTLVYNERDRAWCAMPGLYVGMPKSTFDPRYQRSCGYYTTMNDLGGMGEGAPDLLFSFVGAKSHRIRARLLKLSHPRAYVGTSGVDFFDFSATRQEDKIAAQKQFFAETVRRSKFVLCPRGVGTSSIRLYEVLAAGRVPVIISDEWTPALGPDWDQCSLRVREAHIEKLPLLLERSEPKFEDMARQSRRAYCEWFAPDVTFHRLIESCRDLLQNTNLSSSRDACYGRQYFRCASMHAYIQSRDFLVSVKNRLLL